MPIELMIQKTGISAYIRLKTQLANPFDTKTKTKPHLQYWESLITELGIETPITDACNERVWEKTYNVNLESLKGGKKHLRHSEYTIYTDGSKKQEGTGGGVCSIQLQQTNSHPKFQNAGPCNSIPSRDRSDIPSQ